MVNQAGNVRSMSESEFNQQVDVTQKRLKTALDEVDYDLNYAVSSGVLTRNFENGAAMVCCRQPPIRQCWLTARRGRYHGDYDPLLQGRRDTRCGEYFRTLVTMQMRARAGLEFCWSDA
jgi:iron donor protein CyaY